MLPFPKCDYCTDRDVPGGTPHVEYQGQLAYLNMPRQLNMCDVCKQRRMQQQHNQQIQIKNIQQLQRIPSWRILGHKLFVAEGDFYNTVNGININIDPVNHFEQKGTNDGAISAPWFNVTWYRISNGCATNKHAKEHFRDVGLINGNRGSIFFDPIFYYNNNSHPDDIHKHLNGFPNEEWFIRLLEHWINHGLGEGRPGSKEFDPVYYMEANQDAAEKYGAKNYMGAYIHYILIGAESNRPCRR